MKRPALRDEVTGRRRHRRPRRLSCSFVRPSEAGQGPQSHLPQRREQRPKSGPNQPTGAGTLPLPKGRHTAPQMAKQGENAQGDNGREKKCFSLYCASGTDMRQEPCPALFLKIGPRAAQRGSGLPPGSPVIRRRRSPTKSDRRSACPTRGWEDYPL